MTDEEVQALRAQLSAAESAASTFADGENKCDDMLRAVGYDDTVNVVPRVHALCEEVKALRSKVMSDGCGTIGCAGCLGLEGHASNCPAAKQRNITIGEKIIGYIKKLEPHEQSSLVGVVETPTSASPDWYFTDRTYGDLETRDVGGNTTITTFTAAEVAVLRVLIQSYAQAEREDVIGLILKMTGATILATGEERVALVKKLGC